MSAQTQGPLEADCIANVSVLLLGAIASQLGRVIHWHRPETSTSTPANDDADATSSRVAVGDSATYRW